MRHPSGVRLLQALTVADVDLGSSEVRVVHRPPPDGEESEGLHTVAWFHGEPVGELTLVGDPEDALRRVASQAVARFADRVDEHCLRDLLATPAASPPEDRRAPPQVIHPSPTASAPDVAVAVCTRDRPEDLRRCLEAIGALEGPVAEVLVIDNASADARTRDVVSRFPGVRYVREPRQGLDWARNRALVEARASVVALTDDDVLVHPGWVRGLRRAFAEEVDATVVTGLVLPAELATPAQVLFEARGGFGRGYSRTWFSSSVDSGEVAARRHAWIGAAGTGANLAVRRQEVLDLGGFDTALDVGTATGGGGDLELLFRVVATGRSVVYEPSAVVRHRHRSDVEALERQRRGDGSGSYSWWVGAGRDYAPAERRALRRAAARWAVHHHVRRMVLSALWPGLWPLSLTIADARGAAAALAHRYYDLARADAEARDRAHPDEPRAPHRRTSATSLGPSAVHRPRHQRIEVDLVPGDLVDGTVAARGVRELEVVVQRCGLTLGTVSIHPHGAPVSAARVRWAVSRKWGSTRGEAGSASAVTTPGLTAT